MPRSGWLAIGTTVACLLGATLETRTVLVLLVIATGLVVAASTRRGLGRPAVAMGLGIVAVAIRLALGPTAPTLTGVPEGRGPWTMVVETVGSPREGQQVATLRTAAGGATGFRLAATLPRFPAISPGDTVEVGGRTRPRPDSSYGQYLERLGAWGSLDARTLVRVDAGATGPAGALEGLRRAAADALTVTLPEPEAGLAAGILIGLRDRVDRDVAAAFTIAGVSHVVAISGWNIAIVAAAIAAVAGGLGRRRRALVTVVAITAYIAFAGASPSVLRAGAMAGVVLLARETGRAGYASAALGWAVVVLLLVDPGLVADAGFQLSTVATAGLIAWATPLTERLGRAGGGRLPRWLAESLGVSLAAQAATLPIVLASFGRLAVIAPAVNLLVVPLVAPAMAAGLIALLAGIVVSLGAPPAVGAILAAPAWVALRLIVSIVEATAGLPLASVTLEPPWGSLAGGLVVVAVGAGLVVRRSDRRHGHVRSRSPRAPAPPAPAPARPSAASSPVTAPLRRAAPNGAKTTAAATRLRRAATLALVTSLAVTGAVVAVRPSGAVRVTVLDVGQGDAILVEGADGGRLLIDGGPDPDRLLVVLDRHIPPWDRRIDAVILSHPHEDHVAGLALLLDRYRVARVFEPGMRGPGPGYAAWLERLGRPGAPVRLGLATGDHLAVDAIRLRVLWPDRGSVPREPPDTGTGINNVSIVLYGEVGGRRFLLTGDIEQDIDPIVLARGIPRVDLLKIAHHGSKTATTAAFVAAAHPSVAIASAGVDNPYGHPARSTLDRLRDAGARVYRTDRNGTVTVTIGSDGLAIRTEPRPIAERVADARLALAGTSRGAAAPVRSFVCALPTRGGRSIEAGPVAPSAASAPVDPRAALAAIAPTPDPRASDRLDHRLRYHRPDDGPLADSGRCPAALPRPAAVGAAARARRRRGRRLAGGTDRTTRDRPGPSGRGSRSPAPRRRQAAFRGRPGARPPPWRGLGGVADPLRPPGAGPPRREPSCDPARRRRGPPTLGGIRQPRGAARRVRRQARGSAPGVDGCPVRLVGASLPGRVGCRYGCDRACSRGPTRGGRVPRGRDPAR